MNKYLEEHPDLYDSLRHNLNGNSEVSPMDRDGADPEAASEMSNSSNEEDVAFGDEESRYTLMVFNP